MDNDETTRLVLKEKRIRYLIDALSRIGIIAAVFLFAHYNGAGYLWFLLLLLITC